MSTLALRSQVRLLAAALLVAAAGPLAPSSASAAPPVELFFSEYVEGSSNNKALEIYNGTGAAIDLAAGGYSVQMFFNGDATAGLTINLTGTVAAGDVYVVAQSRRQRRDPGPGRPDQRVRLVQRRRRRGAAEGHDVIDVIGQIGFDPGTEWGTGLTSTADNTLRRKPADLRRRPQRHRRLRPGRRVGRLRAPTPSTGSARTPSTCSAPTPRPRSRRRRPRTAPRTWPLTPTSP